GGVRSAVVGLPGIALCVQAVDEPAGAIDPGAVAVGEGGPVVGLAPGHQPAAGVLLSVAVSGKRLVVDAVAHVAGIHVVQGLEAEDELAASGLLGLGSKGRRRQQAEGG